VLYQFCVVATDEILSDKKSSRQRHFNRLLFEADKGFRAHRYTSVMPKHASTGKKIRDVQRLLAKENLPADVRIEQERKLASLQHEKQVAARQQQEDKMQQKYKMVRFFEERKAVRRLKQARKHLKAALNTTDMSPEEQEAERARWSEEVNKFTVDLSYIENYPATEKYISLYKEEAPGSHTGERRAELWSLAEQGLLRRRKGLAESDGKSGKLRKKVVDADADGEDAQDHDDFFES
jgi:hypothetical protein